MIELLTISQVAQRAGVRTSTIRYYEQIDLLPTARRSNGRRQYDASILERLAFIQVTQNLGFTLAEIQRLFHHQEAAASLPELWQSLARQKLADVNRLIQHARSVQQLLIDGLGWNLLRRAVREAPYLGSLLGDAQPITSGVPSTTVTSLASLGTGLPPGQHGMVGYTSRVPSTGEILNALTWESDLVARAYQTKPTFFERAVEAGVAVSSVALERFQVTGLTEAALRGADFVPFQSEAAEDLRIELTVEAAARGDRSVVYAYERELDHCGHVHGCGSETWLEQLRRIDAMCERLRDALPDDVRLIVTGDHGMVDVAAEHQIVAEDEPVLMAGVSALAGEGRFRQLYVDEDRPWTSARGDGERLADRRRDFAGMSDEKIVLGDRQRDAGDVGLLKCVGPDQAAAHLAGDADDRR